MNGTIANTIDRSCVTSSQLAELLKKKVDDANMSADVKTVTEIHPVTLFQDEGEIPILNETNDNRPKTTSENSEKAKILQERLVQCCIDYILETGDTSIQEVNFRTDSLQESAKQGSWQPCTDSYIELNTYDKENNEFERRKLLAAFF